MQRVDLKEINHEYRTGMECPDLPPNVPSGDLMFYEDNVAIGFYIENVDSDCEQLLSIIDSEFRSKRVDKTMLSRSDVLKARKDGNDGGVLQYSTILGGVPKKPHMMRNYSNLSSVHRNEKSKNFIKAMLMLSNKSSKIYGDILPEVAELQRSNIESGSKPELRFGDSFTSTISNYNISAKLHMDRQNIPDSRNFIYTTRKDAEGGNLFLPDYGVVINSKHNSLLCYPAWTNMHGATPIKPTKLNGYRNTHVFYALRGLDT